MYKTIALSTLLSLSTVACAKSPESICRRLGDVEAKSGKTASKEDADKCLKDLNEMREASPAAYECISACTDQEDAAVMGCTFGCVLGDEKLNDASEEKDKKADQERTSKLLGVTERPSKPFNGTIKTYDDKTFSYALSLTDGFVEDASITAPTMKSYELKGDELVGPSVTIMPTFDADLDAAVNQAAESKETVVRKQKTDKGYALSVEGDGMLRAELVVKTGSTSLLCKATVFGDVYTAKKDMFLPWLEKQCATFTVK